MSSMSLAPPPFLTIAHSDDDRLHRGRLVASQHRALRALGAPVETVLDQFLSVHHLLFRQDQVRPQPVASRAQAQKARQLLRQARTQGLLNAARAARGPLTPPKDGRRDTSCDVEDFAALCVSLDRLVRYLVLTRNHSQTQLLWESACVRDAPVRQARQHEVTQSFRVRWDRHYSALVDVTRGLLTLESRETAIERFFPAPVSSSASSPGTSQSCESTPQSQSVRPVTRHDTLVDEAEPNAIDDPPRPSGMEHTIGFGRRTINRSPRSTQYTREQQGPGRPTSRYSR